MSRPLWDRGQAFDQAVMRFTVGRDAELDDRLLPHDALGSAAHARMLARIGILSAEELAALLPELRQLAQEARQGSFRVAADQEDGHTAIEARLTEMLGDAGKRIHTGRSRNDQVIAALRLHGREALVEVAAVLLQVAGRLCDLAQQHRETSVPGYSHTRQAMPSTMGQLFGAHAEGLLDAMPWLRVAYDHLNRSPLGSASGYGVPLPLDREYVAQLLGFSGVQRNSVAVQNDRGKTELWVLGALLGPVQDLGRLSTDLILFSADELGFVRLGTEVTTGSSIMPNKRNPDALELIRAGTARFRGWHATVGGVAGGHLTSGYHRDLQLTKEPFLEGLQAAGDMLVVMQRVLDTLQVDVERCRSAFSPTAAATDVLYGKVAAGEPFRSAYRQVAADPRAAVAQVEDPAGLWRHRTHLGAPGALDLEPERARCAEGLGWVAERRVVHQEVEQRVYGAD